MEFAQAVELEQLFERAQMAKGVDGWSAVDAPDAHQMDLSLTRMELSRDVALLRAEYAVDVPIEKALMFGQPEVYFSPQRPPTDQQVAFGIERLLSPGDAVTWVEARMTPLLQRVVSLMGRVTGSALFTTKYRFRHCVRRDFPAPGYVTIVAAPLDPQSNQLLEEFGVIKAAVAVLEAHSDPEKTMVTELQQLRKVPTWAVPKAAPMHFKYQLESSWDFAYSPVYQQVTEDANYIVVGIRRCVKGPPLLPRHNCSIDALKVSNEWMEAENSGVRFGLPEYLRMFLSRLGVTDVDIYDMLHGRQVVRYQAVLQQRTWQRLWALLETPFRIQRAAYRRLHGGSNAPDITIDMAPRFLTSNDIYALDSSYALADSLDPNMCISDEVQEGISKLPTARTFIHFSENMMRSQMSRVDSEPVLVLSH